MKTHDWKKKTNAVSKKMEKVINHMLLALKTSEDYIFSL